MVSGLGPWYTLTLGLELPSTHGQWFIASSTGHRHHLKVTVLPGSNQYRWNWKLRTWERLGAQSPGTPGHKNSASLLAHGRHALSTWKPSPFSLYFWIQEQRWNRLHSSETHVERNTTNAWCPRKKNQDARHRPGIFVFISLTLKEMPYIQVTHWCEGGWRPFFRVHGPRAQYSQSQSY